jgi:conjugal transfer pilus assembly protein TraW
VSRICSPPIEQQLRGGESGELARLRKRQQRIVDSIEHPQPLPRIRHAERALVLLDPSIVVREKHSRRQGNIIAPAGTRANPLDIVSLSSICSLSSTRPMSNRSSARAN